MRKTIQLLTLVSVLFISIASCNKDSQQVNDKSIISPEGVLFADNIDGIKQHVEQLNLPYIGGEDFEIDSVTFLETSTVSVAVINYTTIKGTYSNVLWKKTLPNKKGINGVGDYTVSCDGCANCRVKATIYEDRVETQCESSCCKMTVIQESGPR